MNKSLYTKLVLMMTLLIVSLMIVVSAFLTRGIRSYYLQSFYQQMQTVFNNAEMADDLRSAADSEGAAGHMADILRAYSGQLGIDSGTRNYYILSGENGTVLEASDRSAGGVEITPNILTALAGESGYKSDSTAEYMDVALPISGEAGDYIVYIKDNKQTVQGLTGQMYRVVVVPEASVTGTIRLRTARKTALAALPSPRARSSAILSTKITAFLIFIPTRPSKPSSEKKLKLLPKRAKPNTTPVKISGIIARITIGSR